MHHSVLKIAHFQLWSPILGLVRGCVTSSPQNNFFGHGHMSWEWFDNICFWWTAQISWILQSECVKQLPYGEVKSRKSKGFFFSSKLKVLVNSLWQGWFEKKVRHSLKQWRIKMGSCGVLFFFDKVCKK